MHAESDPGQITNIWGAIGAILAFLAPVVAAVVTYLGRSSRNKGGDGRGNEEDRQRLESAVGLSTNAMNDDSVRFSRYLLDNIEQLQADNLETRKRLDDVQSRLNERERDWDNAREHTTRVHDWIEEKAANLGAPSRPSWANYRPWASTTTTTLRPLGDTNEFHI